jgi:hypothetical protein
VIALGSQGVAIADLGESGPTLSTMFSLPVVATSADLKGESVAVGGPTGIFLVDRGEGAARLVGYQPAGFGALDLLFDGEYLVSIDWNYLQTHGVHRDGHVIEVDREEGAIFAAGVDGEVYVANYGDLLLQASLYLRPPQGSAVPSTSVEVPAQSTVAVNVPSAEIHAVQGPYGGSAEFTIGVAGGDSHYTGNQLSLVEASNPAAEKKLWVGATFPSLVSTNPAQAGLPVSGERNLIGFLQTDCALQWPEIEDLNWLARHDMLPGGTQLKLLTLGHIDDAHTWQGAAFMSLWDVRDSDWARFEEYAPSLPGFDGLDTDRVFDAVFGVTALLPGPDTTAYYYLDELGRVRGLSRRYRGANLLRDFF